MKQIEQISQPLDLLTPNSYAESVNYEFMLRTEWVEFLLLILKRILAFLFLRVILR